MLPRRGAGSGKIDGCFFGRLSKADESARISKTSKLGFDEKRRDEQW